MPLPDLLIAAGLFETVGRLAAVFGKLLLSPWQRFEVLWGVLPVYASLVIGIFFQAGKKASWASTVASGFALMWVTANWSRHAFLAIYRDPAAFEFFRFSLPFLVTLACMALGVTAIILGVRRKAPRVCQIVGHFTFNTYVLISIYPMQSHLLLWTTERLLAILMFAPVFWVAIFVISLSRRKKKKKRG
jgi:uncharacterized membrane protein YhdT